MIFLILLKANEGLPQSPLKASLNKAKFLSSVYQKKVILDDRMTDLHFSILAISIYNIHYFLLWTAVHKDHLELFSGRVSLI